MLLPGALCVFSWCVGFGSCAAAETESYNAGLQLTDSHCMDDSQLTLAGPSVVWRDDEYQALRVAT